MGFVIATRYFALKTVTLSAGYQCGSFQQFCWETAEDFNGDPSDYGIDPSEFYSYLDSTNLILPDCIKLRVQFRPNWDKTDLDRAYEDAISPFPMRIGEKPKYTLVIIVPATAEVPPYVLEKMDRYRIALSQRPTEGTAEFEDFKLIESFRIRAESILDATQNVGGSTQTDSTTPESSTVPEPLGGTSVNVHDKKVLKVLETNTEVLQKIEEKMPTEQTVYSGTYRAIAKFKTPEHETQIDAVDRLYKEKTPWKNIIHEVYYPDSNIDEIPELDSEVKRIQEQHKRAYPDSYKKRKT